MRPHLLRHYRISIWAARGLRGEEIQKLSGWSDIRQYEIYAALYPYQLLDNIITDLQLHRKRQKPKKIKEPEKTNEIKPEDFYEK